MKQRVLQTRDSYMTELWLALPECKYKNDADELLKDQFIFGIENEEIQDHLFGEISETDNSIKMLYEARKIESKLAQRKMLGIMNPSSLVSVDAMKNRSKDEIRNCNFCGHTHGKGSCLTYGKICKRCGWKTTLRKKCRQSSNRSGRHKGKDTWFDKKNSKCTHRCEVHKINESCQSDDNTGIEDLMEQIQSLFYHWIT